MDGHSASSRPLQARGLRRVTLPVPVGCAEGLLHLARELRARQSAGMSASTAGWRRLSPSAELFVDPRSGARCAVRIPARWAQCAISGPSQYSASVSSRQDAVEISQRRDRRLKPPWRNGARCQKGRAAMPKAPLGHLFWRAIDRPEYVIMDARLPLCDLIYGPSPRHPPTRYGSGSAAIPGHGNNHSS